MNEYRREIAHDNETVYAWVDMGPIPNMPAWHQALYAHGSYPFPTDEAAHKFATTEAGAAPGRPVKVRKKDGEIVDYTAD